MRANHHGHNANRSKPHRSSSRSAGTALGRLLLAILSAGAFALAVPSPAFAQPALWATSPEEGAALDLAPGEIAATFSTTLEDSSSEVTLTGPDQTPIELEPPRYSDTVLIQPMRYTTPGDYTVTIVATFEDGQTLESSLSFSVESIPDMLFAGASAPGTGNGFDEETPTVAATDESDSNAGAVVGVALFVALAGVVGVVMLTRHRARRRSLHSD